MDKQLKIYESPMLVVFEKDLSAVYTSDPGGFPSIDDSGWPPKWGSNKSQSIQDASPSFDSNSFSSPTPQSGVSNNVTDYNPFAE